ncbi:hypothetical protein CQA70_29895, partial [Klebsiella pneumoniae]
KLRGEHSVLPVRSSAFVKTSPSRVNEPYYGNSASLKLRGEHSVLPVRSSAFVKTSPSRVNEPYYGNSA